MSAPGGETRAALFGFGLTLMDTSHAITDRTNAFADIILNISRD